jgi:hypothetical protein
MNDLDTQNFQHHVIGLPNRETLLKSYTYKIFCFMLWFVEAGIWITLRYAHYHTIGSGVNLLRLYLGHHDQ